MPTFLRPSLRQSIHPYEHNIATYLSTCFFDWKLSKAVQHRRPRPRYDLRQTRDNRNQAASRLCGFKTAGKTDTASRAARLHAHLKHFEALGGLRHVISGRSGRTLVWLIQSANMQ